MSATTIDVLLTNNPSPRSSYSLLFTTHIYVYHKITQNETMILWQQQCNHCTSCSFLLSSSAISSLAMSVRRFLSSSSASSLLIASASCSCSSSSPAVDGRAASSSGFRSLAATQPTRQHYCKLPVKAIRAARAAFTTRELLALRPSEMPNTNWLSTN